MVPHRLIIAMALAVLASACTTTRSVQGLCGSQPNQSVCLGKMNVRDDRVTEFQASSRMTIDAIASDGFLRDLDWFVTNHARTGGHEKAWRPVTDARSVVAGLLAGISGVEVDTMSDPVGTWWLIKSFGKNKAIEGDGTGPILVNPFYDGAARDYANTIGHEAAHRPPLSLRHPNFKYGSYGVGSCEPPYVIGSLVEKQVRGSNWSAAGHCRYLEGLPSP
jgi:hypothetical protein